MFQRAKQKIKHLTRQGFVLACLGLAGCLFSGAISAMTASYHAAVTAASPSVVNLFTTREVKRQSIPDHPIFRYYFGDQGRKEQTRKATSLGSGVVINRKGYILTNNHVVEGAKSIKVGFSNGMQAEATVVGGDAATDVAVIKIEPSDTVKLSDLQPIVVGHVADAQVGDVVLAIGNPYGLGQTVTQGIISALGRNALGINRLENFIQTDAAINPGNSGGALVDTQGHLLGINTAIFSRSGGNHGIGFAIPINLAQDIFSQLVAHGKITRGWLGVKIVNLNPQLKQQLGIKKINKGVVIVGVELGSPANRSGLITGDVVVRAAGKAMHSTADFVNEVSKTKPKQHLTVKVIRQNKEKTLRLTVGARPDKALEDELPQ